MMCNERLIIIHFPLEWKTKQTDFVYKKWSTYYIHFENVVYNTV